MTPTHHSSRTVALKRRQPVNSNHRFKAMTEDYHKLAKDAGNKLRSYVLAYASGATGVFFLALVGKDAVDFTSLQKILLLFALALYVLTVILCLFELHIDARRFFNIAAQHEKPKSEQNWGRNERYKKLRVRLLYWSYLTAGLATVLVVIFLVSRIYP
jgi:amino acid transporter